MPLTQDMLIDLALNVVGYIAAGALSLVIYSMFHRPPRPAAPAGTEHEPVQSEQRAESYPATVGPKTDAEFVGFGESAGPSTAGGQSLTLRRNRAEVLRLARGMLRSGASDAEIKAVLPVSDAELAVLNYERT